MSISSRLNRLEVRQTIKTPLIIHFTSMDRLPESDLEAIALAKAQQRLVVLVKSYLED